MECYNGGYLNPGTCKCTCGGLWTGEKCETGIYLNETYVVI